MALEILFLQLLPAPLAGQELVVHVPFVTNFMRIFMPVPPTFEPVALIIWYPGDEELARKAFSSVLSLGPIIEQAAMTTCTEINAFGDPLCAKGGQKSIYAASLPSKFSGPALAKIWGPLYHLCQGPQRRRLSAVMFECYSTAKVLEVAPEETAFALRCLPHHEVILPSYSDPATAYAGE